MTVLNCRGARWWYGGAGWLAAGLTLVWAADQPQWGERYSRNQVSAERGLPVDFEPASGRNVRWVAELGTEAHSTPVIGSGRVLIGTNNGRPRDPRREGDRGVLMCFDEADGRFCWQLVIAKYSNDPYQDWPNAGMSSPATIEGDRVYMLSNRGEVVCLDLQGQANGNDGPFQDEGRLMARRGEEPLPLLPTDADVLWVFDIHGETGTWPHDAAHTSFLLDGPWLYANTGNGVDNTHRVIRRPEGPSLIVLDRRNGWWVARDDEGIGPRIFHSTWSSPALGTFTGSRQVVFCGGDGVVYGFDALAAAEVGTGRPPGATNAVPALKKRWSFDCDPKGPKEAVHRYHLNRREGPSNIFGLPVVVDGRVYVAGGGDLWWGKNEAWLKCLEPRGEGDLTAAALIWSYPLNRHTFTTPAVANGLVWATDCEGTLHCVDAATGQGVWTHELGGETWASPLVADGRVYVGTRRGDCWVLAAGREQQVLAQVPTGAPISATVVAANRTLYVTTMSRLYAVADAARPAPPAVGQ